MNTTKSSLEKIPVYEVRLVQSRRPLRLAETTLTNSATSARALYALIAITFSGAFSVTHLAVRS